MVDGLGRNRPGSHFLCLAASTLLLLALSAAAQAPSAQKPLYKQAAAPIDKRLDDLLQRMTLEEKVRQLDMYSSAREIMSAHTDDTHSASDAAFITEKAQAIWGDL